LEVIMSRTLRVLLAAALTLSGAGWFMYHLGSRLNLAVANGDQALWDQAPGDVWLYAGGLMMLISGSLLVAAFLFWKGTRREVAGSSLNDPGDR
jgi:hypothetical protein